MSSPSWALTRRADRHTPLQSPGVHIRPGPTVAAFPLTRIHIATEGPLGLCGWFACRRADRPFTTCYHTRYPEYLAARRVAPSRFVYALLRRFHNAGSGMMVSTETLGRELDTRGFVRLMRWSHGVDCALFRPRAASIFEFPRPIFLTCARVAVEKNLDAF